MSKRNSFDSFKSCLEEQYEMLQEMLEKDNDLICISKDDLKGIMFDIIMSEFKESIKYNPESDGATEHLAVVTSVAMRLFGMLERKDEKT